MELIKGGVVEVTAREKKIVTLKQWLSGEEMTRTTTPSWNLCSFKEKRNYIKCALNMKWTPMCIEQMITTGFWVPSIIDLKFEDILEPRIIIEGESIQL